jgi:hypothetical protein
MSDRLRFHLGDLLSITSGVLVSPSHIGGVYQVIDGITGQAHLTHQLPRASEEIRPYLLEQLPFLADVDVPRGFSSEAEVITWLAEATAQYGEYHEVTPMPFGAYVGREPIAELQEMAPGMEIIQVDPGEDNHG